MKFLIVIFALLAPTAVFADSRCVAIENGVLINKCETCIEATVHELRTAAEHAKNAVPVNRSETSKEASAREARPRAEHATGIFSGVSKKLRLDAAAREPLMGGGSWIISELNTCH